MNRSITRLSLASLALCAACQTDRRPATPTGPADPTTTSAGPNLRSAPDGPRPALTPAVGGSPALPTTRTVGAEGGDALLLANDAADILWSQTGSASSGVWYMNGTTAISDADGGWSPFSVSSGWRAVAAADFDADGSSDVLFHQTGTSHFGIWLMDDGVLVAGGVGWFPLEASAGWEVADAADFDGDDRADLLWRNPATGQQGIWRMNGVTPKPEPGGWVALSASAGWHADVAGDFDLDGHPDIVWHRTGSTDFGVWRMNGTAPVAAGWTGFTASAGWEPIDAADFTADGRPDLLWRNDATGGHGVWQMGANAPAAGAAAWTSLAPSAGWTATVAADFGFTARRTYDVVGSGGDAQFQCATRTGGQAVCWGLNTYGQLGDGSSTSRPTPSVVTGAGASVTALAQGGSHTCAIATGGQVHCWGRNDAGQLGSTTNNTSGSTTPNPNPLAVTNPAGVTAFGKLAAGGRHTCALAQAGTNEGKIYCWGYNGYGQLGNSTPNGVSASPTGEPTPGMVTLPSGVTRFTTVSAGLLHTCALTDAGQVYCWGNNSAGQIGGATSGTYGSAMTPQIVALPTGVTSFGALAAGSAHNCALAATGTNAGRIYCWGGNSYGQLGVNSAGGTTLVLVPQPAGVTGWGALTGGDEHTCAIASAGANAGRLYCWGANNRGQLGNTTNAGTYSVNATPLLVPLPPGVTSYTAVNAGAGHTCAIASGNTMRCWGQ